MTKFVTGASRDTGGKGRCDLLPHQALLRVSEHVERSLDEHEERDWERGLPMHCMLDSAMRHLFKYMDGRTDEDHLAAATTNLLMAMWTEDHLPEMQDIPTRPEHDEYLAYVSGAFRGTSEALATSPAPRRPTGVSDDEGEAPVASPTQEDYERFWEGSVPGEWIRAGASHRQDHVMGAK